MSQFRHLMGIALCAGAFAGFASFAVQQWTVQPLIEAAEAYEAEALQSHSSVPHEDQGWQPGSPVEQNLFTAFATILTGIGFAAILFAVVTLAGQPLTVERGVLWGLAGFASFALAPALGLPPVPPGAAVADLQARQFWWIATAVATAAGLWLLVGQRRNWPFRIAGGICVILPHAVGAPVATGENLVPAPLVRQFAIAVLAGQALFWLLLGVTGGFLYSRVSDAGESQRPR